MININRNILTSILILLLAVLINVSIISPIENRKMEIKKNIEEVRKIENKTKSGGKDNIKQGRILIKSICDVESVKEIKKMERENSYQILLEDDVENFNNFINTVKELDMNIKIDSIDFHVKKGFSVNLVILN